MNSSKEKVVDVKVENNSIVGGFFLDTNCFRCGRNGHIKIKCHRMEVKFKVKNISEDGIVDEVHAVMCCVMREGNVAPMLCELDIQGNPIEFEVHIGSPYNIMCNEMFKMVCYRSFSASTSNNGSVSKVPRKTS